jgi:hypothetical protein
MHAGADAYGEDAMAAVDVVKKLVRYLKRFSLRNWAHIQHWKS